jgi:DNA-binding CsgD family transcriptional regulator
MDRDHAGARVVTMIPDERLRPLERRVRRLVAEGVSDEEIGRRFRRSPEFAQRVYALSEVERAPRPADGSRLRPLERRILRWREAGAEPEDIGARFHRSPGFVAQVEDLAHYKLASTPG